MIIHYNTKTGGRVSTGRGGELHHMGILKRRLLQLLCRQDWWGGRLEDLGAEKRWICAILRSDTSAEERQLLGDGVLRMDLQDVWESKTYMSWAEERGCKEMPKCLHWEPWLMLSPMTKIPQQSSSQWPLMICSPPLSINCFWALILHREASMYKITGPTSCVAGASREIRRENQHKPRYELTWHTSTMGLGRGHMQ